MPSRSVDDPKPAGRSAQPAGLSGVVLRPVRGTNAFEATVEQLATAIRLGVFSAGDRLPPERELAGSMNVSRATLREAIAALRQAGMVATRSGRGGGTVVAERRAADSLHTDETAIRERAQAHVAARLDHYRDALVVRRVVEPGAAFVAANTDLAPAQREWLRGSLHAVEAAHDRLLQRQADSRLHLAIAQVSGSARLLGLVTDVQRDLHDLLTAIPVLAVNMSHSDDEHGRIVEAILDGNADAARTVMESHCDATAALLRGLLGMHHISPRRDGTL